MIGDRVLAFVRRHSTAREVAIACAVLGVYTFLLLGLGPAQALVQLSGGPILETMFAYSAHDAYAYLDRIGEAGRAVFLREQWFDLFYPPVFAPIWAFTLAVAADRVWRNDGLTLLAAGLMLLSGLVDYCEDACLITMLRAYPQHLEIAEMASVFTSVKVALIATWFVGFTALCVAWRLRTRPSLARPTS